MKTIKQLVQAALHGLHFYFLPAGCHSLAGDLVGSHQLQTAAAQFPDCAQYREVEQSGKLVGFIPRRSQVQILPSLFTWFRTLHPDIPGTRKTSLKEGVFFD